MFVGRLTELTRLEACLLQAKAGRPLNFMITGERGIGKSSLLNYIKWEAEGKIPLSGSPLSFLVVDTDIDAHTTQLGLLEKIRLGLESALTKSEATRTFFRDAWSFLQRVEAGGLKLKSANHDESEELLVEKFSYTLADLAARVTSTEESLFGATYDGILILIDEADNASKALNLGSFLKLLAERLQRRECRTVLFGLAGLPQLRDVLSAGHPSSLRLFEELTLGRLSTAEVNQVIDICLREANNINPQATTIIDAARGALAYFAEGYPHFIQQFGFSAFSADINDIIEPADVFAGATGKGGALELIGDRYYRDNFYSKIQSDSYRRVLRIMAEKEDAWVTKDEIRGKFKGKETTLTNAIKTLLDRQIILSKEGAPGVYRLQHRGFAWWIRLYTADPLEVERSIERSVS
jgi:Cdc6-like AAA superfamily ATPase